MKEAAGFPVISLSGTARDRGHAYGESCRHLIGEAWAYYEAQFFTPLRFPDLRRLADLAEQATAAFSPAAAEEIGAIARSANIDSWKIFALNARTELINVVGAPAEPECTSLFFEDSAILGQTWDWTRAGMDLGVVLKLDQEDGRKAVIFTEAGMLGKIGMNSDGIGVGINILQASHRRVGVPVAVLGRELMRTAKLGDALLMLQRAGAGRATYFLLGDAEGHGIGIEFCGDIAFEILSAKRVLVHTNHFLAHGLPPTAAKPVPGSLARLRRATEMSSAASAGSLEGVEAILNDRNGGEGGAINAPWRASSFLPGQETGTCATIIMDLKRRTMLLRRGQVVDGPFTEIVLN